MVVEEIIEHYVKNGRLYRTRFLFLKCDTCGIVFKRKYSKSLLDKLHFHNRQCQHTSCKFGGAQREKTLATCVIRFSGSSPQSSTEIKDKTKQTCLERFGTEHAWQSREVRLKIVDTMTSRYGEKSYLTTKECRKRLQTVSRDRWGVDYPSQSSEVRSKVKATTLAHYGVFNVSQAGVIKRKKAETCAERFGVNNPFSSKSLMAKVDWEEARDKRHETMKRNGTFSQSKPEEKLFVMLCDYFGMNDIQRQVKIHKWPIDFYIKSINTYVQLDGVYWHGLDRQISVIAEHKTKRDVQIHKKWLTDREQELWFAENKLVLVRISELKLKEPHLADVVHISDLISTKQEKGLLP